jgi:hypothetical protein
MASVVREAVIEVPAARCWDAVRAFDVLPDELGPRVAGLMDAGLKAITDTLEG